MLAPPNPSSAHALHPCVQPMHAVSAAASSRSPDPDGSAFNNRDDPRQEQHVDQDEVIEFNAQEEQAAAASPAQKPRQHHLPYPSPLPPQDSFQRPAAGFRQQQLQPPLEPEDSCESVGEQGDVVRAFESPEVKERSASPLSSPEPANAAHPYGGKVPLYAAAGSPEPARAVTPNSGKALPYAAAGKSSPVHRGSDAEKSPVLVRLRLLGSWDYYGGDGVGKSWLDLCGSVAWWGLIFKERVTLKYRHAFSANVS